MFENFCNFQVNGQVDAHIAFGDGLAHKVTAILT